MSIEELEQQYGAILHRDIITEHAAMRAMLTTHQWVDCDWGLICPECHNLSDQGHTPDCALAALLGNAETAPATPGGVPSDVRGREDGG